MNGLEDVKNAAEDYMKKQLYLFYQLALLTPDQVREFKEWFNKHPYNERLKGIPQPL